MQALRFAKSSVQCGFYKEFLALFRSSHGLKLVHGMSGVLCDSVLSHYGAVTCRVAILQLLVQAWTSTRASSEVRACVCNCMCLIKASLLSQRG